MQTYIRELLNGQEAFTVDIKLLDGTHYEDRPVEDVDAIGIAITGDIRAVLIPWTSIASLHVLEA